jgi:hypothetical protein
VTEKASATSRRRAARGICGVVISSSERQRSISFVHRILGVGASQPRFLGTMLLGLLASSLSRPANADASSWFSLAGGAGALLEGGTRSYPGALQIELGLGSSPASPIVVGGVVKSFSYFGSGTDLALTLRTATGGFARGDFGFALDAGAYQRWWGVNSTGFFGAVVVGLPYGLQLTAMTEQGTNDRQAYAGTFGIDFLRLTVYRGTTGGYWPNPMIDPVQARR